MFASSPPTRAGNFVTATSTFPFLVVAVYVATRIGLGVASNTQPAGTFIGPTISPVPPDAAVAAGPLALGSAFTGSFVASLAGC
jgi:hypothetical protein